MTPARSPWIMAVFAVVIAVAFALLVRLPLPFPGFAAVTAAGLAALGTFALGLFLPPQMLWTDSERLFHAFRSRHRVSDARAADALEAITTAHGRAAQLRAVSEDFAEALKAQTIDVADTLDGIARELFYAPQSLNVHRKTLIRSELIEEAVTAHAALRARRSGRTEDQLQQSRTKVATALTSLQEAFGADEERFANRILTEVDVSSSTAETLLAPRGRASKTREETP